MWRVEPLDARVEMELRILPADMREHLGRISALLEAHGPQLVGMPHVRFLGSKLWEMRMQGRAGEARAIYTAVEDRGLVILHAFVKKTRRTARRDLDIAIKRSREIRT
jgi:phage-related protein